ncbi:MAG: FecR domain-containing protein [Gemmatimonadetes bacterium]|nr:FecR domain-containing protein [Gemmatimonadota bacterium]
MRIEPRILIARLTGEASEEDLRLLAEWRAASAENEEYYRAFLEFWEAAGDVPAILEPGPPPAVEEVLRSAETELAERLLASPPSVRRPAAPRRRPRWTSWTLAAAALVVLGIGLGALVERLRAPEGFGAEEFVTASDEVATLVLRDGSVVRLAPETRLTVGSDSRRREVALEGRAYFAVRRSDLGPFTVRTPGGEARVLGTRFDVNARGSELEVVVVDGAVEVAAAGGRVSVRANEVVRVIEGGEPVVEPVDDVFAVLAWLGQFFAFEATPIEQVAEEFRRRFDVVIEIVDPSLASRTVTGWFTAQTPEEMLAGICRAVDAECTVRGRVIRMEARAGARPVSMDAASARSATGSETSRAELAGS